MELLYLCAGHVELQWSICGIWKQTNWWQVSYESSVRCNVSLDFLCWDNRKQSHGHGRWRVSKCPTFCLQLYSLQPLSDLTISPKHFSLPSFVWTKWLDEWEWGFRQVHWTGMCQSLQNCGLDWSMGLLSTAPSALVNPPEDVRTSCMLHCSFVLFRIHFPLRGSTMRTFWSSVHSFWPGMVGVL